MCTFTFIVKISSLRAERRLLSPRPDHDSFEEKKYEIWVQDRKAYQRKNKWIKNSCHGIRMPCVLFIHILTLTLNIKVERRKYMTKKPWTFTFLKLFYAFSLCNRQIAKINYYNFMLWGLGIAEKCYSRGSVRVLVFSWNLRNVLLSHCIFEVYFKR